MVCLVLCFVLFFIFVLFFGDFTVKMISKRSVKVLSSIAKEDGCDVPWRKKGFR